MDTKTLIIAATIVGAAACLILGIIFWTRRTYPGFGYWFAGSFCHMLAGIFFLLPREHFPPWLTIVLANFLLFFELVLYLRGTVLFRGEKLNSFWDISAALCLLTLLWWFTYIDPSINARIAAYSFFSVVWTVWLAYVLLRTRPPYFGSFDRWQAGFWMALSVVNLGRGIYVGLLSPILEGGYLSGPALQSEWLLLLISLSVLVAFSQVMMNAQRLEHDWRQVHQELQADIRSRQLAEEKLQISEERHRLLAENALDVIWTIEPDGRISYVSPAVEKLRGYTPEEAKRQPLEEIHPPESLALSLRYFQDLHQRALAGLTLYPFRGELEYWCRDGSSVWCDVRAYPILDADRKFHQLLGVSRDISERKRHEFALREARDLAEQTSQALQAANVELQRLATTDTLTGVYNRRYFEDVTATAIERAKRYGEAASLLLIDIDHFKSINDVHGHLVGDQILIGLTARVGEHLRSTDVLARWGGEEFVILLPHTNVAQALPLADKLRALIAEAPFPVAGRVTASFGVAEYRAPETIHAWMKRVDEALYQAKASGRNRVQHA